MAQEFRILNVFVRKRYRLFFILHLPPASLIWCLLNSFYRVRWWAIIPYSCSLFHFLIYILVSHLLSYKIVVYNFKDFLRSWNHILNMTAVQSTWKELKSFINNVLCPSASFSSVCESILATPGISVHRDLVIYVDRVSLSDLTVSHLSPTAELSHTNSLFWLCELACW